MGSCGFKGPPNDNRVEIAYFIFPQYEGRGIATQIATAFVSMVGREAPQVIVAAQTLPKESPSASILKKLGFKYVATLEYPEYGAV